jgi:hypothetical protein
VPNYILTPIDAPGRPDQVLNSYLHGLTSLEKVVVPHLSMAARAALVADDLTKNTEHVSEMGRMFYDLATLNNSLHQLSDCLMGAYHDLEIFATEGADFEWFAHYKQDEAARESGRTRKKPSNWKPEPKTLVPYQLRTVLSRYFAGGPGGEERIGTSQAADFCYHSDLLRNGLTFGLRDPGRPAIPTNLTTRRPDEALDLPAERPDERWDDCDVSLSGPEAVAEFEAMLTQCHQAGALYNALAADDAEGYKQLFRLLVEIVDGEGESAAEVLSHISA